MPPGAFKDWIALEELRFFEELLKTGRGDLWDKGLSAEDILTLAGRHIEHLFHEPPMGPIPEYLQPHLSVYGCVAEYEDKLEELDRWKAAALSRWLIGLSGARFRAAGRLYRLGVHTEKKGIAEKFRFLLMEDDDGCDKVSRDDPVPAAAAT